MLKILEVEIMNENEGMRNISKEVPSQQSHPQDVSRLLCPL